VLHALATLEERHTHKFGTGPARVLAYVGTASQSSAHPTMFVCPLAALTRGRNEASVDVALRGVLPREPAMTELVTLHVADPAKFRGYQIKTQEMLPGRDKSALFDTAPPRKTVIHGERVFTVHHTPNTVAFFDRVPVDEIIADTTSVHHVIAGVGPGANISPRFIWHHELCGDRVRLVYGDGHLNKTAANFARNPHVTVAVIDLSTAAGYVLQGAGRRLTEADDRAVYRKVLDGFASGGWGVPAMVIDVTCWAWQPIRSP
jgi:hypothetical protein